MGQNLIKKLFLITQRDYLYYSLLDDNEFWIGCKTCKNYDVLTRTKREMCLCTGMLYEPKKQIK